MGKLVGYGLRKPVLAGEMGYMLGVCLKTKLLVKQRRQKTPETNAFEFVYCCRC